MRERGREGKEGRRKGWWEERDRERDFKQLVHAVVGMGKFIGQARNRQDFYIIGSRQNSFFVKPQVLFLRPSPD